MSDLQQNTNLVDQFDLALAQPTINHAGRKFIGFMKGANQRLADEQSPWLVPPDDAADLLSKIEVAPPNYEAAEHCVVSVLATTLRQIDSSSLSTLYTFLNMLSFSPEWTRRGAIVKMTSLLDADKRYWCKTLDSLTDVQIFRGREITLPPAYFGLSNIASSSSALIMALVFSDGTLLPLCCTVDQSLAYLERQRTGVIKALQSALALKQPLAVAAAKSEITTRTVFDPNDLKIEFERKHWVIQEQVTKDGRYIAPQSDTSYYIKVRNNSSKAIDWIKADVGLIHDGESFEDGHPYENFWSGRLQHTTTRFRHSGIEQFTINLRPVSANGWSFQALRARDFNRSRVAPSDKWVLLRVYGRCGEQSFLTHVTQGYLEPPKTIEAGTETRRYTHGHTPPSLG